MYILYGNFLMFIDNLIDDINMRVLEIAIDSSCSAHQVSQYTFAMCSYREKKPDPTEMMQLDGFTVDYCEPMGGRCLLK